MKEEKGKGTEIQLLCIWKNWLMHKAMTLSGLPHQSC